MYTLAKYSAGELIFAEDSEKGELFSCPVCDSKLILRKSGRSGPGEVYAELGGDRHARSHSRFCLG